MGKSLQTQTGTAKIRDPRTPAFRRRRNRLVIAALILAVLIAVGFAFLVRHWPFTQAAVAEALQETVPGRVQIEGFRRTYFPGPGCVADGVVITGGAAQEGRLVVMVQRLTIETGFLDLFRSSIREVRAEGLRVIVPPGMGLKSASGQTQSSSSNRVIREFVADGAMVEFERQNKEPLRFELPRLTLLKRGHHLPIEFKAVVLNPEPPGEITAGGQFGPWRTNDPGGTPLSGSYRFENARLDVFKGVSGTLNSQGKFSGDLAHVKVEGTTTTPDFEVRSAGHRVHLTTRFTALVDGTNGDTLLPSLDVRVDQTSIASKVTIKEKSRHERKITTVDASGQGRIQDLLRLFSADSPPAMTGPMRFKAAVTLPSGPGSFLQKVALAGDFAVDDVHFSKPATQAGLDTWSARAQGHKVKQNADAPLVAGDLQSHVVFRNGIATFSGLNFRAPGASAELSGTYNLLNDKIGLQGGLQTQASLSHNTTGIKAILLKPLDPFFKKRRSGAAIGVSIKGTYEKPSFGIDLDAQSHNRAAQ